MLKGDPYFLSTVPLFFEAALKCGYIYHQMYKKPREEGKGTGKAWS